MQKADLQVVNRLNLKFRGRNAWPLFRSYRPGYHPWYLTSNEAKFLALALHLTMEVSLRFKKEETLKLLEPATSRLGIKLRRVKRLIALEEAQRSMSRFFTR